MTDENPEPVEAEEPTQEVILGDVGNTPLFIRFAVPSWLRTKDTGTA